jgi:hypothetical protein
MSQIQPDPTPGDTSWFTHDRFGMVLGCLFCLKKK